MLGLLLLSRSAPKDKSAVPPLSDQINGSGGGGRIARTWRTCTGGWAVYCRQTVMLANLSLAMLYMTVRFVSVWGTMQHLPFVLNISSICSCLSAPSFEVPSLGFLMISSPQTSPCLAFPMTDLSSLSSGALPGIPHDLVPEVVWPDRGRSQHLQRHRGHHGPARNICLPKPQEENRWEVVINILNTIRRANSASS